MSLSHESSDSRVARFGRALRSGIFFLLYCCYLVCIVGLGQRLLLWPAIVIVPRRRRAMVGAWLRFHARATLALARVLAGVRVTIHGTLPDESCIAVMNHQSVLDIPIGLALVHGPYPLIPTRDRYRRGIPGISPLTRIAGYPFLSQKRVVSRAELQALTDAADSVARGEHSFLIFPEGHRTRDGGIGRFMRSGLRIVLARAQRPIYCVIVDGMAHTRTFAESFVRFAGTRVSVTIVGPIPAPPASADDARLDAFIDSLHDRMVATLDAMRQTTPTTPFRAPAPAG